LIILFVELAVVDGEFFVTAVASDLERGLDVSGHII
jgi:hypothetical protein